MRGSGGQGLARRRRGRKNGTGSERPRVWAPGAILAGLALLALLAQSAAAAPRAPDLGLTLAGSQAQFSMPAGWMVRTHPDGWVLSGPEGDPTYYTTITVQQLAPPLAPLDALVDESLLALVALPNFTWIYRGLEALDGSIGVRNTAIYELHETVRYQSMVTIPCRDHVLNLSYMAPLELAPDGLPAFYDLLASLTL